MYRNDLEKRREQILEFVVASFIQTASPVGSSTVSKRFNQRFSSATVRNDMAELEELGLLRQPHTSAGRIPTDRGYRYYVDKLVEEKRVPPQLQIDIAREMASGSGSLEEVLESALRILSLITRQASIVLLPDWHEDSLKRVHFSSITPQRFLGSWLMTSGSVFSRVVELNEEMDMAMLEDVAQLLNSETEGLPLSDIETFLDREIEEGDAVFVRLRQLARFVWRQSNPAFSATRRLVFEGYRNILEQPEFQNAAKIRSLIGSLEDKHDLLRILQKDIGQEEVQIHIGREDFSDVMSECSLVTAGYAVCGRPMGVLGVLGPRRMPYSHVMGSCRYMSQLVGGLLGGRSS